MEFKEDDPCRIQKSSSLCSLTFFSCPLHRVHFILLVDHFSFSGVFIGSRGRTVVPLGTHPVAKTVRPLLVETMFKLVGT